MSESIPDTICAPATDAAPPATDEAVAATNDTAPVAWPTLQDMYRDAAAVGPPIDMNAFRAAAREDRENEERQREEQRARREAKLSAAVAKAADRALAGKPLTKTDQRALAASEKKAAERTADEHKNVLDDIHYRMDSFRPSDMMIDTTSPNYRPLDEAHVQHLATILRVRGSFDEPIKINDTRELDSVNCTWSGKVSVWDGWHRVEAWKRIHGDAPMSCLRRSLHRAESDDSLPGAPDLGTLGPLLDELAAIQANLCRLELTPLHRAQQLDRLKDLQPKAAALLHEPEAPAPELLATVANKSRGRPKCAKSARAIAESAGNKVSRRTVARDLKRANAVPLDKVEGTSLASAAEVDALAALPEPERAALIERAAAGEKVTARAEPVVEADAPVEMSNGLLIRQMLRSFHAWRAGWDDRFEQHSFFHNWLNKFEEGAEYAAESSDAGDADAAALNAEEDAEAAMEEAAKMMGVSVADVRRARRILQASPYLHADVKAGKITLDQAEAALAVIPAGADSAAVEVRP